MEIDNSYDDALRASAYAQLEFPGTYYLAFRDLPSLIQQHVQGRRAVDFGYGTGRSTRFLKALGFQTVGVDIAEDMLTQALERDPEGEYVLLGEDGLDRFTAGTTDLILSAFTFDNVPELSEKITLMQEFARMLSGRGVFVNLVSSPDIYVHEWASFSTRDFPENRHAGSGDRVRIINTDIADSRPVKDVVCSDADYQVIYVLGKANE